MAGASASAAGLESRSQRICVRETVDGARDRCRCELVGDSLDSRFCLFYYSRHRFDVEGGKKKVSESESLTVEADVLEILSPMRTACHRVVLIYVS